MANKLTKQQAKDRARVLAWLDGKEFRENAKVSGVPELKRGEVMEFYIPRDPSYYGQFYTPLEIVQEMTPLAALPVGDLDTYKVLDPCAGIGHFIQPLYDEGAQITCFELDEEACRIGEKLFPQATWINDTPFLEEYREQWEGQFDLVVLNPPFNIDVGLPEFMSPGFAADRWLAKRPSENFFFELAVRALKPTGELLLVGTYNVFEKLTKALATWFERQAVVAYEFPPFERAFKLTRIKTQGWLIQKNVDVEVAPGSELAFSAFTERLLPVVTHLNKIVTTASTLAVLAGIRFTADQDAQELKLEATDLQLYAEFWQRLEVQFGGGEVTIPAKPFYEWLRLQDKLDLLDFTAQGGVLQNKQGRTISRFKALGEFPGRAHGRIEADYLAVQGDDLETALKLIAGVTARATGWDPNAAYKGTVKLVYAAQKLLMYATDGVSGVRYQVACREVGSVAPFEAIIERVHLGKMVQLVKKAFDIRLQMGTGYLACGEPHWTYSLPLTEVPYPDIESVLEAEFVSVVSLTFTQKELLPVLQRIKLINDSNNLDLFTLQVEPEQVQFHSRGELGATEETFAQTDLGELQIDLSSTVLHRIIAHLPAATPVTLTFQKAKQPVRVTVRDYPTLLALFMPLSINQEV